MREKHVNALQLNDCEENPLTFLCPPSKKRGHIVLLMSVGLSVCLSVGRSVDQLVSANYLGIQLSQGSHILCGAWSW